MSGGLRFRAEAIPFAGPATNFTVATRSFAVGTIVLVPAAGLIGVQRPGIYRIALIAAAAATFVIQDTNGGVLSATYPLPVGGIFIMNTPEGGDPLWQPAGTGLGLQIVVATSPIVGDIWTAMGA
jgi:hypothetical protein